MRADWGFYIVTIGHDGDAKVCSLKSKKDEDRRNAFIKNIPDYLRECIADLKKNGREIPDLYFVKDKAESIALNDNSVAEEDAE